MYTLPEILHTFLIVLPFIFAIQFLSKRKSKSQSGRIMGFMLIFVAVYYIVTARFILPDNIVKIKISENLLFFLFLSITPFFYLYTFSLTTEKYSWKNKYLIHFIPSLFVLIWSVFAFNIIDAAKNPESYQWNISAIRLFSIIFYNIQVFGYSLLMLMMLTRHSRKIKHNFSYDNENNNLNWLKIFLAIFISFSILDLLVYYLDLYENWPIYYYAITNTFFTFIAIRGLNQPDIYYKAKELSEDLVESPKDEINIDDTDKRQLIPDDKSQQLFSELKGIIETEKLFMNKELSIYDISKQLNVNKTYISYVINHEANENFNSFINHYRIDESKKLLLDSEYDNYTIETIANIVGFHSKSSFNTAFKKQIGQTPSEYKKLNR